MTLYFIMEIFTPYLFPTRYLERRFLFFSQDELPRENKTCSMRFLLYYMIRLSDTAHQTLSTKGNYSYIGIGSVACIGFTKKCESQVLLMIFGDHERRIFSQVPGV